MADDRICTVFYYRNVNTYVKVFKNTSGAVKHGHFDVAYKNVVITLRVWHKFDSIVKMKLNNNVETIETFREKERIMESSTFETRIKQKTKSSENGGKKKLKNTSRFTAVS